MRYFTYLFIFFNTIFLKYSFCQQNFEINTSVQVFDKTNVQLLKPWVGGINHVQVSEVDLNLDGINDLVIFDRAGNKLSIFINQGISNTISYVYAPHYRDSLPQLHDWVLFRDYNCDGKMDIFSYSSGGAAVYKNTSQGGHLSFQLTTSLVYSDFLPNDGLNNPINLYISSTDIPAIDDIDGDGDLDILTFSILGSYIEYHKNLSKELYGTCDSLRFMLSNKCWGYFAENLSNNSMTLHDTCNYNISNPQRQAIIDDATIGDVYKKHSGSTLLTLDLDANNAKDLVLGDVSYFNLTALYNGDISSGLIASHMIAQDPLFPANTNSTLKVEMNMFPAAFYLDVNNDNVKDLLVSNNCYNGCENTEGLWLYLNNGSNNLPNFSFQQKNFLQGEMIEVGERSNPVFFDYNGDGLLDLVIGNYGKLDTSLVLHYKASLSLYQNMGSNIVPSYKLIDDDFAGISSINLDLIGNKPVLGLRPTFGDLDNDGDNDMFIGDYFGNLHYFINTAGTGNPAVFVLNQPKYQSIDVGNYAAPQLVDLNRDGKLDLVIGKENGYFSYYQNTGTLGSAIFTKITDSLGRVSTKNPMFYQGNSIPWLVDVAGSYVMFSGSSSGHIFKFGNIDGNLSGTFTKLDTNLLSIFEGTNSSLTLVDVNADSYLDLIIGNQAGGLTLYNGTQWNVSVSELSTLNTINLYPNPTKDLVNINLGSNSLHNAKLELIDMFGKIIIRKEVKYATETLNTNTVSKGVYLIKFTNSFGSKVFKLVKN